MTARRGVRGSIAVILVVLLLASFCFPTREGAPIIATILAVLVRLAAMTALTSAIAQRPRSVRADLAALMLAASAFAGLAGLADRLPVILPVSGLVGAMALAVAVAVVDRWALGGRPRRRDTL